MQKFTRKLLQQVCADYGIPVPEVQRGTPSTGTDGVCVYGWRGGQCLIVAKRTTDMDLMLHELAHAIVGPRHGHDQVWDDMQREINVRYTGFDPRTGRFNQE